MKDDYVCHDCGSRFDSLGEMFAHVRTCEAANSDYRRVCAHLAALYELLVDKSMPIGEAVKMLPADLRDKYFQ